MIFSLIMLLSISLSAYAQTSGTSIEISGGTLGGSYYDVPTGFKMDKYGNERLSPKGLAFTGKLDSDQFGKIFFRSLSVQRSGQIAGDKTKLGKQTLFTYETPRIILKEKENLKLFVKGDLLHYSHKDRFIYFQVDDASVPDIEKNLQMEDHMRVDQNQTYVGPSAGVCYSKDYQIKEFDFSGFAELNLMPVAFMHYENTLGENTSSLTPEQVNKSGNAIASGGEIAVEGIAKYKGKYYFKARISQNMVAGFSSDKPYVSNRIGHYELGYFITKELSANVSVQNNELLVHNKDRHAIDVYNIVGVGMKWKIPYKKN